MTLVAGTRLGPYEILSRLGAGGMADVYRARDAKLGRDVAVKVLPPELSHDADRRFRFEQEARAASSLNHPSIVSIYDVGSEGSVFFIVMELVEGRTLREMLASGPLPTRKLVDLAIQVADGLAKAHGAGIVHRDLKPENLMVSREGHVKILDFGLAKLVEPDPPGSRALTRSGMIVGTIDYMSPEQAAGDSIDHRSDQFALGTILYEMASGRKPFERRTIPETLNAILKEEPVPLGQLDPTVPLPLRWIVEERCLAKDPDDRYASSADLLRELRSLRDHLSVAWSGKPAPVGVGRRPVWLAAGLLGVVLAVAAGFLAGRRSVASRPSSLSFRRLTFHRGSVPSARFAPDGQTVVFGAAWEGRPVELFSTRTDGPESRSLELPSADILAISPGGEMAISLGRHATVGWEATGTLASLPLVGRAPREIQEDVEEADWAPDGKSLAVVRDVSGKRRLEFPAGRVLYETTGYISFARVSPRGDRVAFLDHAIRGSDYGAVAVVDLAGRKTTLAVGSGPFVGLAWTPAGDEVWFTAAKDVIYPELRAVTLSGRERLVLQVPGRMVLQDISRDGRLLMVRQNWRREILAARRGAPEVNLSWLDWSLPVDLSNDGSTVLFQEQGEGAGAPNVIYFRKIDGSAAVRLGEGRALGLAPDGRQVLASRAPLHPEELLLIPMGAGQPSPVSTAGVACQRSCWFPDGERILISGSEPDRGSRLYVLKLDGGKAKPMTPEGFSVMDGNPISPDGRQVVARGPDRRFYSCPVDGGDPLPVSGLLPEDQVTRWTPDGKSVFAFQAGQHPARVYRVDVSGGGRTLWKELMPPDPAGVSYIGPILVARDGESYAYSYRRLLDDLYLVEGLK